MRLFVPRPADATSAPIRPMVIKKMFFADWFLMNGRCFPWRKKAMSPFGTLVTELLLRQTRAENVAGVWELLLRDYETPLDFAKADPEKLYRRVRGLGFGRQKVEALKEVSMKLLERHSGNVPSDIDELLQLPHVGLYTANATMCFGFGARVPIVDSNVLRFFSRFFGEKLGRDNRHALSAWNRAEDLLPKRQSSAIAHNYGLLDFTAQVCKPIGPSCSSCPLARACSRRTKEVPADDH